MESRWDSPLEFVGKDQVADRRYMGAGHRAAGGSSILLQPQLGGGLVVDSIVAGKNT